MERLFGLIQQPYDAYTSTLGQESRTVNHNFFLLLDKTYTHDPGILHSIWSGSSRSEGGRIHRHMILLLGG